MSTTLYGLFWGKLHFMPQSCPKIFNIFSIKRCDCLVSIQSPPQNFCGGYLYLTTALLIIYWIKTHYNLQYKQHYFPFRFSWHLNSTSSHLQKGWNYQIELKEIKNMYYVLLFYRRCIHRVFFFVKTVFSLMGYQLCSTKLGASRPGKILCSHWISCTSNIKIFAQRK